MQLPEMQPEVATPTPECPNPARWRCFDGMGTEVEVLEFLYSLVKMLKPRLAIETGTYKGFGTLYLAKALVGDLGFLHTAEPDRSLLTHAEALLRAAGVDHAVSFHQMTGEKMIGKFYDGQIDFAFLDSNLDTRIGELLVLVPKLAKNAIVAVHDTNTFHDRPGAGGPRTPFLRYAEENNWQVINFDTPRGLALLRKRPER